MYLARKKTFNGNFRRYTVMKNRRSYAAILWSDVLFKPYIKIRKFTQESSVDIVMGPFYYNILKYQRPLFLHEGGSPAFIASQATCLGERVFSRPGLAWIFGGASLSS